VAKEATAPTIRYLSDLPSRYTNYFQVGHNSSEVLIDCGCFYETDYAASIHTRVATTPVYAKALLETLAKAMEAYEASFGAIGGSASGEAGEG